MNIGPIPPVLLAKQPEFEHLGFILRNSKHFLLDTATEYGHIYRLGYVSVLYLSETIGRTKGTLTTSHNIYPFVKIQLATTSRRTGEERLRVEYMQVSLAV